MIRLLGLILFLTATVGGFGYYYSLEQQAVVIASSPLVSEHKTSLGAQLPTWRQHLALRYQPKHWLVSKPIPITKPRKQVQVRLLLERRGFNVKRIHHQSSFPVSALISLEDARPVFQSSQFSEVQSGSAPLEQRQVGKVGLLDKLEPGSYVFISGYLPDFFQPKFDRATVELRLEQDMELPIIVVLAFSLVSGVAILLLTRRTA